jgi:hypothetical protein
MCHVFDFSNPDGPGFGVPCFSLSGEQFFLFLGNNHNHGFGHITPCVDAFNLIDQMVHICLVNEVLYCVISFFSVVN